jgi:hypothetical protein
MPTDPGAPHLEGHVARGDEEPTPGIGMFPQPLGLAGEPEEHLLRRILGEVFVSEYARGDPADPRSVVLDQPSEVLFRPSLVRFIWYPIHVGNGAETLRPPRHRRPTAKPNTQSGSGSPPDMAMEAEDPVCPADSQSKAPDGL